jgi:hypothetical protein
MLLASTSTGHFENRKELERTENKLFVSSSTAANRIRKQQESTEKKKAEDTQRIEQNSMTQGNTL